MSTGLVEIYCPLVLYNTVAEYRDHFTDVYCETPLWTFDDVEVMFHRADFGHAFFEGRLKNKFSWARAERIDWIGQALEDPSGELFPGWDPFRRCYGYNRRVCLVGGVFAVVIEFVTPDVARFKTAYPAEGYTPSLMRRSPRWR